VPQGLTRTVLFPFLIIAAIGFILSVAAHTYGLMGWTIPGGNAVWSLHVGIFIVWIPTVLVGMRITRDGARKDFWKMALAGCPDWMRYGFYGVFAYAAINFILFIGATGHTRPQGDAPPSVVRGFSGHWMVFYYAAFAVLYSAIHSPQLLKTRLCPNGHPVSHADSFCPTCGAALTPAIAQAPS
jgi:hypothetical protein